MNHNTEELIRPKFSESEPTSPERTSSKQKQQDDVRKKIADWKSKANITTSCSLAKSGQGIHKQISSAGTTTFVTLNPQKLC